ncbi:2-C-methyl-D-erythritol 4-phosphate cytidylyltransferase [Paenibacillus dokdonensis]|uniref:2-C-methyl-D-erythritol 4-phosphate cytidylyltransferase n=1 Tax=Paenibacillus dokdonensis TaxID=2567944 RepID=A0ABU6GVY9_9BACL|nr:2-C-methyl-D-erythritol 4-phosphate cytidylyltransferase [Paenibacillus dokdonensis]MEC0243906.1 2-C-methyl-D-erythritol 4-phosphate cytidylyltransferase [Paenibacillus dokdonensis]
MDTENRVGVVVVSAGRGTRMGTRESKQYLLLKDKPIIMHTLDVFERMPLVQEIVLVTGAEDIDRCTGWIKEYGLSKVVKVISGGSERQQSVYKGLLEIGTEWVMVHDGVRPFIEPEHVEACFRKAQLSGAAVLAVKVKDTIKQVSESGTIEATPDRRSLWAIHTPQAFRLSALKKAHEQAEADGFIGTDDSMLVERMGIPVAVVESSYTNIKITTPEDLEYAEFMLKRRGERNP